MLTKSCKVTGLKTVGDGLADDGPTGQFEAIVSVFGNKDSYGDIVVPGAFSKTLDEWGAKGDPIPIYYSHRMDDPDFNIGQVLEAKETDDGLWVKGQLDMESPKAVQTYRLMKGRRLTQFSFAYGIREGEFSESDDAFLLKDLDLYEVGPTPVGANPATELLAVKTARRAADHMRISMKAGREVTADDETALRAAYAAIGGVLDALDAQPEPSASQSDAEKASTRGPVKREEPSTVKREEPSHEVSVETDTLARLSITMMKGVVPA